MFGNKSLIIPIGYEVTFIQGGKEVSGYVNKQMFPGYECMGTNPKYLRYGVQNAKDDSLAHIVHELDIVKPNIRSGYFDKSKYRDILSDLKSFKADSKILAKLEKCRERSKKFRSRVIE